MHTLYYSPGACSLAPHIVLEEIGRPYQLELVSAKPGGRCQSAEWARINPKRRVPALSGVPGRIGGQADLLTEAHAIMFYLARSNLDAGLLPNSISGEARCIEWINWLAGNVHTMSYGQIFRPQRFVDDGPCIAKLTERGRLNLLDQYGYIERLLSDGRDWAVPGQYTIVDPYLLVFFHWGERIGLAMASLFPSWSSLTRRLLARPAVERTLRQEEISITAG